MHFRFPVPMIAALAAVLLFASCSSKTNKEGKMIRKTAGFVVRLNSKSLAEKVNMAEFKQSDLYKDFLQKMESDSTTPEILKKAWTNPSISGVDSLAGFVFFGETGGRGKMKFVLEGGLKDPKAFESFLKQAFPDGSVSKDGDIQSMPIKDRGVVTWDKDHFAFGAMGPQSYRYSAYDRFNPGGSDDDKDTEGLLALKTYCIGLYSLKSDENLTMDKPFTELMSEEGDIQAWVNVGNMMGENPAMGMMDMLKIGSLIKDNVATYSANFEKGKFSVKMKQYFGKELASLVKKYSGGTVNTDMLKSIPSKNVVGVLAMHFKPEGVKALLELFGAEPFINSMVGRRAGFTIDDFVKANKGDIMVSVSDLTVVPDTSLAMFGVKDRTKPDAKYFFAAAIDDKEAFNKLIKAGIRAGGSDNEKVHYNSNAKYFAVGNDENMITQFLAGNKTDQSFLDKIGKSPIGAYVDIRKIMGAFEPQTTDSLEHLMLIESQKIWDNVTFTGGDYSDGSLNSLFEVNLIDQGTNSLQQLMRYFMKVGELESAKKKKRTEDMNDFVMPPMTQDSIRFMPPKVEQERFTPPKIIEDVPVKKKGKNN